MKYGTTWRTPIGSGVRAILIALACLATIFVLAAPNAYPRPQCGGQLTSGSAVRCSVSGGDYYGYTFDGTRGSVVTIRMTKANSTLDPFLELHGPNGELVTSDDDSAGDYNSLIRGYSLPATGRYTIVARSLNSDGHGEFTLEFSLASASACGGAITYDQWWENQKISAPGQKCRFTFDGEAGVVVSIAMAKQAGSSLDCWLDLLDPSGYVVAQDDDSYGSGDALIDSYRLHADGRYTIVARSYNDASAGTFSIYLQY